MTSTHTPSDDGERQDKPEGRAKGGIERARRMTPEQRSANARKAAQARWDDKITDVICGSPDQPLQIGDVEIECYVLEDGTRVLTQASFLQSLGRHRRAQARVDGNLPVFLQGKAIAPYISDAVQKKSTPISFRRPGGGRASGFNAELLPEVCEIYLKARETGVLPANQQYIAHQAEIIMRGLARVGIVALVDEATGYQAVREKNALAKILETFIDTELQAWVKTFPEDFYREMFRLRGLPFEAGSVKRPQYFGIFTNDIVYKRIAPGVLDELKRVNPKDEDGRRKHKLFQKLTQNVGYPKLREHLGSVVTIMKLSDDWEDFMKKLNHLHPRFGDNLQLPIDDDGKGL
jgi:hypothetical protein